MKVLSTITWGAPVCTNLCCSRTHTKKHGLNDYFAGIKLTQAALVGHQSPATRQSMLYRMLGRWKTQQAIYTNMIKGEPPGTVSLWSSYIVSQRLNWYGTKPRQKSTLERNVGGLDSVACQTLLSRSEHWSQSCKITAGHLLLNKTRYECDNGNVRTEILQDSSKDIFALTLWPPSNLHEGSVLSNLDSPYAVWNALEQSNMKLGERASIFTRA